MNEMHRLKQFLFYIRESPTLGAGFLMVGAVLLFGLLGPFFVDTSLAQPLSSTPRLAPSWDHLFGTDDSGRDLLAVMVVGVPLTLRIGLLAGALGLGLGTFLGFTSGYIGGRLDGLIRVLVDTLLTVPPLVVLVSIASTIREEISVNIMALVVASLAWMWPARVIRSQVLSMRERAYVQMAKLNGLNTTEIIWKELFPNLLPYLAANFANAVNWAILASIGLEALGLGPQNDPTIGMTIYWAITFSALIRGMWWWWAIPIIFIALIFIGLLMIAVGLDKLANPKGRKAV
jgi:peptide/nickel transport system permease protein